MRQAQRTDGVYEVVVGKQADEQVPDVNQGGVGTRFIASGWGDTCEHDPTPVGRDKSGPYPLLRLFAYNEFIHPLGW